MCHDFLLLAILAFVGYSNILGNVDIVVPGNEEVEKAGPSPSLKKIESKLNQEES